MKRNSGLIAGLMVGAVVLFFVVRALSPSSTTSKQEVLVTEQWSEHLSPSKRFSVSLPSVPQHAVDSTQAPGSTEKIRYHMMLSKSKGGALFMITMIEYPPSVDVSNTEGVLLSSVKEIAAGNPQNQIVRTDFSVLNGCPSLDFVMKNRDVTLRGTVVLQDRTLFVLTVADVNLQTVDEAYSKLLNSFRIHSS